MTIINSLMVGVSFRATSDFFICMIKEKKREDKDYLSILYPYRFHSFCVSVRTLTVLAT